MQTLFKRRGGDKRAEYVVRAWWGLRHAGSATASSTHVSRLCGFVSSSRRPWRRFSPGSRAGLLGGGATATAGLVDIPVLEARRDVKLERRDVGIPTTFAIVERCEPPPPPSEQILRAESTVDAQLRQGSSRWISGRRRTRGEREGAEARAAGGGGRV